MYQAVQREIKYTGSLKLHSEPDEKRHGFDYEFCFYYKTHRHTIRTSHFSELVGNKGDEATRKIFGTFFNRIFAERKVDCVHSQSISECDDKGDLFREEIKFLSCATCTLTVKFRSQLLHFQRRRKSKIKGLREINGIINRQFAIKTAKIEMDCRWKQFEIGKIQKVAKSILSADYRILRDEKISLLLIGCIQAENDSNTSLSRLVHSKIFDRQIMGIIYGFINFIPVKK
jgi:hypothetical protein